MATSTHHWTESFLGAYATPQLVGREDILANIGAVLQRPASGPQMVVLSGDGGIGKTRLLNAILERAQRLPGLHIAQQVIDLYHVQTHTSNGLAYEMADALNLSGGAFPTYERERRNLERLNLLGQGLGVRDQRERTLAAFSEDLKTLTQNQRVLIALDTAERYIYGLDNPPLVIRQAAESWSWLVNVLPQWGNVVVVMAGRPSVERLTVDLTENSSIQITTFKVADFSEEESLAYFGAVSEVARLKGDFKIEKRIANLTTSMRQMAHRFSGGRPILLALFIDYLSVAPEQWPEVLSMANFSSQQPDAKQLADARNKLEGQIVARLRQAPRLGDTIVALGRLPKGADKEVLARLLDVSENEAQDLLKEVQDLSFVKIRPKDRRVFLHDELYAILQRQIYAAPGDGASAAVSADAILAYYRKQRDQCIQDLDRLYSPAEVEGKAHLDLERLSEVHATRRAILTEIIYYRLRQDAVLGYQRFYRYIRDALRASDTALDVQLQAELLAFQSEVDAGIPGRSSEGLDRSVVIWAVALRPVLRAFAEQDYRRMLQEAETLKVQRSDLLATSEPVSAASLDVWLAVALTYLGGSENFAQAHKYFTQSIRILREQLVLNDTSGLPVLTLWRVRASLALAYHFRGYLQRLRGYTKEAVENYSEAAVYWRQTNIEVELANTLNDMGFATAELGYWADARSLVQDALQRRRELGARAPVALSYNTLAIIAARQGDYEDAVKLSEKALTLSRALAYSRGIGLALIALAEAKRRYSRSSLVPRPEDKINYLRAARQHALEAYDIFVETKEASRQAEALIEIGCACRDWLFVLYEFPNPYDDVSRLKKQGVESFNKAAETGGVLQVDALVNLAWLGMYMKDENLINETLARVERAIPTDYYINKATGKPTIAGPDVQVLLWPLIGKQFSLKGHRAFARYINTRKIEDKRDERRALLREAINNYFWGLQYSSLYGDNYVGILRVKEEIYSRFRDFLPEEMQIVADEVTQLENEYHLDAQPEEGSALRQFLKRRALLNF